MLEPAVDVPARPVAAVVSDPARLAAVLDAAVDASARPDGAAVPDAAAYGVYPLIILIVYVIVTGGILCSGIRRRLLTTHFCNKQPKNSNLNYIINVINNFKIYAHKYFIKYTLNFKTYMWNLSCHAVLHFHILHFI